MLLISVVQCIVGIVISSLRVASFLIIKYLSLLLITLLVLKSILSNINAMTPAFFKSVFACSLFALHGLLTYLHIWSMFLIDTIWNLPPYLLYILPLVLCFSFLVFLVSLGYLSILLLRENFLCVSYICTCFLNKAFDSFCSVPSFQICLCKK